MSAGSQVEVEEVKWLVWLMLGWTFWLGSGYQPVDLVVRRVTTISRWALAPVGV
jgi:hypothetical protein